MRLAPTNPACRTALTNACVAVCSFHMAQQWYDLAKQLDPTRLVNTADGVCCGEGPLNETTDSAGPPGPVDFRSAMCCGPIFRPKPYHFPTPPKQPAISHETGKCVHAITTSLLLRS